MFNIIVPHYNHDTTDGCHENLKIFKYFKAHLVDIYLLQTVIHEAVKLDPMFIVLIVSLELRYFGPLISVMCRLFDDNTLSATLHTFENIHQTFIKLNISYSIKKKTLYTVIIGFAIDYAINIGLLIKYVTIDRPNLPLTDVVSTLVYIC